MALNASLDEGNSSTNSPNIDTTSDNLANTTLTESPSINNTLIDSTFNNNLIVNDTQVENFVPEQTPTLLATDSDPSLNATSITNLSDPTISLMNSTTTQVTLNQSPFLSNSNGSLESDRSVESNGSLDSNGSLTVSDTIPNQSATPDMLNRNVMGHARLDGSMWQAPGVIIGIGCLVLGFTCIIIGTFLRCRSNKKSGRSTRRVRVMSGFDFNDGSEDDYQNNPWHKAHLGSSEKSGFDLDGPITELTSYRHSIATIYSNGDDDESESNKNSQPHLRVETGFAQ